MRIQTISKTERRAKQPPADASALTRLRMAHSLSIRAVARCAGVDQSAVWRIENGKPITIRNGLALARFYEVELAELFRLGGCKINGGRA